MASAFTGQPMPGPEAAIAIAPVMIAYSAALVSNAPLVQRRVKRGTVVPPSVNEVALRDGNRQAKPRKSKPIRRQGPTSYKPSLVMILTRADHPLQEGLKVMNAAKAIFAHA